MVRNKEKSENTVSNPFSQAQLHSVPCGPHTCTGTPKKYTGIVYKVKKMFLWQCGWSGRERSRSQVTHVSSASYSVCFIFITLWQSKPQLWFWILALSLYLCIGFHAVNSFYEHFRNLTVSKEWRNLHYFCIITLIQAGYFLKVFLTTRFSVIYNKSTLLWSSLPNQRCSIDWWIWEIIIFVTIWDCI